MKLSKHQRRIVDEIIKGSVYDIPTYLKVFQKGHICKYDLARPYEKFKKEEGGAQYKVIIDQNKAYVKGVSSTKMEFGGTMTFETKLLKKAENMPDDAWEYREAELIHDINPVAIEYGGETFRFDFMEEGVYVADDFDDVIEFMSLWTYLLQESLILEVPRDITSDDLGILFELKEKERKKVSFIVHKDKTSNSKINPVTRIVLSDDDFYPNQPSCLLSSYMDEVWELNKEHQKNCQEYIGRKILPTAKLRVFARQFYTTVSEWRYRIPLFISIIALLISLIPFIQSLLPSKEIDHMTQISQQLVTIERLLETEQSAISNLSLIKEEISNISNALHEMDYVERDDLVSIKNTLENVSKAINEMNSYQNSEIYNDLVTQIGRLNDWLENKGDLIQSNE
jgi:hypothetical protein